MGYYHSPEMRVSLSVPEGWDVTEEKGQYMIDIWNEEEEVLLVIMVEENRGGVGEEIYLDTLIFMYSSEKMNVFKTSEVSEKEELIVNPMYTALSQEITGVSMHGIDLTLKIACFNKRGNMYTLMVWGMEDNLENTAGDIESMFSSFRIDRGRGTSS